MRERKCSCLRKAQRHYLMFTMYVKSPVFSDAEPSRPVTLLNVLHPLEWKNKIHVRYSVKNK